MIGRYCDFLLKQSRLHVDSSDTRVKEDWWWMAERMPNEDDGQSDVISDVYFVKQV
jgi:hypothetical protein